MFINKFLVVISVLFALNFNIQSSRFGMTLRFHSVLKDCGILRFFFAVLRCSESPNVPLFTVYVASGGPNSNHAVLQKILVRQ